MMKRSKKAIAGLISLGLVLGLSACGRAPEEAEEFLSDCMAVICKDLKDVKDYFDEEGVDISGLSLDNLEELEEVFALPSGRYLIVEG